LSGSSVILQATASDNVAVAGVQFKLDGVNIGAEITVAPYSMSWDTTSASNGTHVLTAVARDPSTNRTTSAGVTINVSNAASSPGSSVLLVGFGPTSSTNTFGLSGWSTAIKDVYTDYVNVGPGGTTIVFGGNYSYNYQGVTGVTRNFVAGDKIRVTWYNNSSSPIPFTPLVSFDDPDRPSSGVAGTWYNMTATTIPPFGTAITDYSFSPTNAGAYSLVNVNVNYTNINVVICDKIELVPSGAVTTDSIAPSVSITSPNSGATVSGSNVTVSASASDNVGVAGLQFKLDGNKLGTELTTPPYSFTWDTTLSANGSHSITAVARDAAGNQTTSSAITVTVNNGSLTVTITAPIPAATVSGSVTVSASAGVGVAGVQFKVDGNNLGSEITTSPYSVIWNTAQVSTGTHILTAVARDTAGNSVTSNAVPVTVARQANPVPTGPVNFLLSDRGAKVWNMTNASSGISVGYARIQTNSGSSPSGAAIFSYRSNGVLVSQATVPVSPLVQSGRIYVEVAGAANTGVAFVNPNAQDVAISFYFTDASGHDFAQGSFTLGANRQISAFLNQSPFNLPVATEGTFSFTSTNSISVIGLRGFTNERGEFLMTTLPVTSLGLTNGSTSTVVPHFAIGQGWMTKLVLINPTDGILTGKAEVFDPGSTNSSGSPLTISVNDTPASNFTYSVPAHGMSSFTLKNIGTGVSVGSIKLTGLNSLVPPTGLAIFSFTEGGVRVAEASVPIEIQTSTHRVFIESSGAPGTIGSSQAGIALANPSPGPVVATLELSQSDGSAMISAGSVTIPPGGQVARFINELLPNIPNNVNGLLRVTASTPIAAIGLRLTINERSEYLMTTNPPVSEPTVFTNQDLLFPQVVAGGGFTTEIVIFNNTPGQSTGGVVTFTAQDGTQASWQLQQ
jgi:hypothetical protein